MSAAATPAFYADSPDAEILEAFERVRAMRMHHYSFDKMPPDPARDAAFEVEDLQMCEDESIVQGDFANTIAGVVARLMLLIPAIDNSRWVDVGLMGQGFKALYREVKSLDGHAQQIAHAIDELLHIEWTAALADYDRSAADFDLVLRAKEAFEELGPIPADRVEWAGRVTKRLDELGEKYLNDEQLCRLIRTLVPDHAAYLRKVEIIIAEGYQGDIIPWLARDTNFLVGRIECDEPAGESR